MRVALHKADTTRFPNLALMKLSAWHKKAGHEVEDYRPGQSYDLVHSSKVFSWTPPSALKGPVVKGGTGYNYTVALPDAIEHVCPDYTGVDFSLGFLTRGCPNKCPWCVVPNKEGGIRPHSDVEEFLRHKQVVLMDNNVLAHDFGVQQIEKMSRLGVKVDFNQGLDARLIDDAIARRLAALKWMKPLRMACDHQGQTAAVEQAVHLLRKHNCTPRAYFVYVLVKDIEDAYDRVQFLRGLGVDPFAQPYRDYEGNDPPKIAKHFARWVNHKAVFKTVSWEDYSKNKA